MILFHGTTSKFNHFDFAHLGEGEGKSKFGIGHYATSVYETAALYAGDLTERFGKVLLITLPAQSKR
jgi:hypothetical protein